jgi:hypothetical protein
MALNLARPKSFRHRIIEIPGEPRNYPLVSIMFVAGAGGRWRCPPGQEYAARYGLSYRLKSSAEIDWRFQRNVLFLEDYLRAEILEICEETVVCFQSLVAANPGITLADLLTFAAQHGLASDLL